MLPLTSCAKSATHRNVNSSIFNAALKNRYGSKYVVFALLCIGVCWLLPASLPQPWLRNLIAAIERHKSLEPTAIARERSGFVRHQSGLSEAQKAAREARDQARTNMRIAKYLESEYKQSNWWNMSWSDRWYLEELWNGNLQRQLEEAEARHGGAVQAPPFVLQP